MQDDLIERLGGVSKVAELTGRRKRMVSDPDTGKFHYVSRGQDVPLDKVCTITLKSLGAGWHASTSNQLDSTRANAMTG